jgi:hypothetical protein
VSQNTLGVCDAALVARVCVTTIRSAIAGGRLPVISMVPISNSVVGTPEFINIPEGMADDLWNVALEIIEDWEASEDRMATDLAFALFRLFRKVGAKE